MKKEPDSVLCFEINRISRKVETRIGGASRCLYKYENDGKSIVRRSIVLILFSSLPLF